MLQMLLFRGRQYTTGLEMELAIVDAVGADIALCRGDKTIAQHIALYCRGNHFVGEHLAAITEQQQ